NFTSFIAANGTQIWNSEAGAWDRGSYAGPDSNFTAWGKALWQYLDASRYYTGMAGAANLFVQIFLRTVSSGLSRYFYYDGRTYASPNYLRTHTSAIEYD